MRIEGFLGGALPCAMMQIRILRRSYNWGNRGYPLNAMSSDPFWRFAQNVNPVNVNRRRNIFQLLIKTEFAQNEDPEIFFPYCAILPNAIERLA